MEFLERIVEDRILGTLVASIDDTERARRVRVANFKILELNMHRPVPIPCEFEEFLLR